MTAADIIGKVANGIDWVYKELRKLRIDITTRMAKALADPVWGGLTLVGLIGGSIILEVALSLVSQLKIVQAVADFIKKAGDLIKGVLAFFHVDLLITLFLLGKAFDPEWQKSLASIYEALGNIAEEIGKDFSFINAFAEVNRSLLYTANSLTGNSWLKSQAAYAEGLSKFLSGITNKLGAYVDNPDQIFIDIQHFISEGQTDAIDTSLGNITAAIALASNWIEKEGNILIAGVNDLYAKIDLFPSEVADAIHKQVDPLKRNFDVFVSDTWNVFIDKYQKAYAIIIDYLNAHDIDIEEIQAKIADPLSWFKALLGMDPTVQNSAIDELYAYLTQRHNKAQVQGVNTAAPELLSNLPVLPPPEAGPAEGESFPIVHSPVDLFGDVKTTLPNRWFTSESDALVYPPGGQVADGKSWYAGE